MEENNPENRPAWLQDVLGILKNKTVRTIGLVLILLVAGRLGLNWWFARGHGVGARNVKVERIALRSIDKTLSLPGNVEAIEQATLYAHVSGYLKKILVDEGDKVKKDELLAEIDAPDILQEYRNAKADYDFKEVTRKRYAELLKESVVSRQEYDKVEAEASQAKARFDNADANLQYTYVHAPFAGSIARRFQYPGDFIAAPTKGGQASPLFMLINESELRISVNVPQKEVGSITLGHAVDIHVDTFPNETFNGKVSRIDELMDEATKTQRVLIDIPNPDDRLHAGMFASVVMHLAHRDNVPMLPKEAVHGEGIGAFVFVVKDGKAVKTSVTLGDSQDDFIEVHSPNLSPGDSVIVQGGEGLSDGDAVKVSGS